MKQILVVLSVLALISLGHTVRLLAQPQAQTTSATLPGVLLSTESLLGSPVRNPQGEDIGKIAQLLINPRTGLVRYAIVSVGGFLGLGEKTIVVPWLALEVAHDNRALVLQVPQQVLPKVPTYEKGQEPALAEHRRQEEIYGLERSGGWGPETPYGRLYNPTQEQTISGKVTSVETGAPVPGMASGIQLLVQTEGEQTTRVHVGPEWYLERQNVEFAPQDSVRVTGVLAEVNGRPVLMAREVQSDRHTLRLRDTAGIPLWSGLRSETQ